MKTQIFGSCWLNAGRNFQISIIHLKRKSKIFVLYKFSFLHYVNNLWVPIEMKPALNDHESYDVNSFLLITNLILFFFIKWSLTSQKFTVCFLWEQKYLFIWPLLVNEWNIPQNFFQIILDVFFSNVPTIRRF